TTVGSSTEYTERIIHPPMETRCTHDANRRILLNPRSPGSCSASPEPPWIVITPFLSRASAQALSGTRSTPTVPPGLSPPTGQPSFTCLPTRYGCPLATVAAWLVYPR